MVQYLLHENRSDCSIVTELGFPAIIMHLANSKDGQVREAALRGLLELEQNRVEQTGGCCTSEEDGKLKEVLQERIEGINVMSPEDLGAAMEERHLVDALWRARYDEPSSLQEKGLLYLPGEDAPAPDVASKHFEPPLRAWAANRNPDVKASSDNKGPPLLLAAGPSAHNASNQNNPNNPSV